MWKRKTSVAHSVGADIRIVLPASALTVIFDECDGFDRDETGGRVIGTYTTHGAKLTINVTGIIESGPQARRSAVSFFQDGEYQEGIFRRIESRHPEIEHLGNWHTHHVNGLSTLSGGDIETYHRIVNHHNHNTPFFYALLVTAKHNSSDPLHRYTVKHFVFRRGDPDFVEIPRSHVEIVDSTLVWPAAHHHAEPQGHRTGGSTDLGNHPDRVYDQDVIRDFYAGIKPFKSQKLGMYWRGNLELLDGTEVQVVVVEDSENSKYSVTLRQAPEDFGAVAEQLAQRDFPSARAALIHTERACNLAVYKHLDHKLKHHRTEK
jgi:hypothetical protein